ncbi:MAG: HAMP domain-containing sensor histidine kinase [Oscillospiraceae bacterium]
MKSIYFKNFIATAAMVLLSFLMLGSAFVFIGRSYVISSHRDGMDLTAKEVVRTASATARESSLSDWGLRRTTSSIALSTGNHIFITDDNGVVVSCSDMDVACPHIGRRIGADVMYTLRTFGVINTNTDLGGFYGGKWYVVALPIISEETKDTLGYVFVGSNGSTIVSAWESFLWVFFAMVAAVTLLALVMSLITSKRMAKPLDEMAAAARKFAHGDFSVRVSEDDSADELAALTSSFNNMADSLAKSEELRNEFIANVSHELKTPMTTIAGFADGILDGTIPKEQEDKYLATIADETRRLSRLVRRMLDLSQMKSRGSDMSRRRSFDINELIIRVLLSFETRADERRLDVDLQLPEDHMTVVADPDAITQVLHNLLDNAMKFAENGSVLSLSLWKNDGRAFVSVKNRGDTIPEDDLPLIFDRFHKSDRSRSKDREGVGLGLYLVKSILDAHNEDIAVTSREGVTEFVFTLRLAVPPKAAAKPAAKTNSKPTTKTNSKSAAK